METFTKSFIKEMEILQKENKLFDHEVRKTVEMKMIKLGGLISDEASYLFGKMEDEDNEEIYYYYIHALARML